MIDNMFDQGLSFLPGSRLEAKDFNEKWYAARVVETDWIEREVLIHFDKWSTRFDEWIPMNSSRLRPQTNLKESKLKTFAAGEKILATWVDGKKYPAKVKAVLGSDKYDVLFDDGYSKVLRTSKITKLAVDKSFQFHEEHAYIGSKQDRRDRKRKHTITDLFHSHSKKKVKVTNDRISHLDDVTYDCNIKLNSVETLKLPENLKANDESSQQSAESNYKCNDLKSSFSYLDKAVCKQTPVNPVGCAVGSLTNDYSTFVGNLRVEIEDSSYKCPKLGCNKNFRKENLLQMHIKHYHPEYSRFVGLTPNVADLAYARTTGEPLDEFNSKKSKNCSAQTTFVQEISQFNSDGNSEVYHEINNKDTYVKNPHLSENLNVEQNSTISNSQDSLLEAGAKVIKFVTTTIKTLSPPRQSYSGEIYESKLLHPFQNLNKSKRSEYHISKKKETDKKFTSQKNILCHSSVEGKYKFSNDAIKDKTTESKNCNYIDIFSQKIHDMMMINGDSMKFEKLRREEIINCICGIIEEDGLMIQCDLCLCWQHGHCNAIEKEKDVPEKYICYICQNAHHQRTSKKYFQDQDWIRDGFLPTLLRESYKLKKTRATLKRLHDLISGLIQIKQTLHSLRVKLNVILYKNHPKLYLWANNWDKIASTIGKAETIPLIEIIKTSSKNQNISESIMHEKFEISSLTKNCISLKYISSDSELMKILEEDNIQVEENKLLTANTSSPAENVSKISITQKNIDKKIIKQEKNVSTVKNEVKKSLSSKPLISCKNISENLVNSKKSSSQSEKLSSSQPSVPQPEALIDPVECKLRLLQHIDQLQVYVTLLLNFIEKQMSTLENFTEKQQNYCQCTEVTQMLSHDLLSVKKLAATFL